MPRIFISTFLFVCFFILAVKAQNYKGIWNGYITTDGLDAQASFIISIEEQKEGIISGKALLYKPNLFTEAYGLIQFIGVAKGTEVKINELIILDERRGHRDFYLCIKDCDLQYSKADTTEILTGKWSSASNLLDCLPGKISLSRYKPNTGSYVPEYVLRVIKGKDQVPTFKNTQLLNPTILNVKKHVLDIEIKDYMKEDNDTVTLYLNRIPVATKLNIKKKGLKFKLHLDRSMELNELIIYAENLGRVPPNTSQLLIIDGTDTHKLMIESDKQKSAALYLRYKP